MNKFKYLQLQFLRISTLLLRRGRERETHLMPLLCDHNERNVLLHNNTWRCQHCQQCCKQLPLKEKDNDLVSLNGSIVIFLTKFQKLHFAFFWHQLTKSCKQVRKGSCASFEISQFQKGTSRYRILLTNDGRNLTTSSRCYSGVQKRQIVFLTFQFAIDKVVNRFIFMSVCPK